MVPLGGHKGDPCLMHPGAPHDMETCSAVEELLQWMIDQGRFEISDKGEKEQHACMQSADKESPRKPKPLVIHFTKDVAPQKHRGPSTLSGGKPVPFPYKSSKAVSQRYAPQKPSERKEEATGIDSLSAKLTNITELSDVTSSGRIFAAPDMPVRPANAKGKAKVAAKETNEASPTTDEDVPARRFAKKREGFGGKEVSLEEANEFLHIIQ